MEKWCHEKKSGNVWTFLSDLLIAAFAYIVEKNRSLQLDQAQASASVQFLCTNGNVVVVVLTSRSPTKKEEEGRAVAHRDQSIRQLSK